MLVPLIALVVILLLFGGLGFVANVLWYILIAAVILWLLGFFIRPRGSGRWYYW